MIVAYVIIGLGIAAWMWLMVDAVAVVARNVGRIADEMRADREERKRQFDLDRQFPRKP